MRRGRFVAVVLFCLGSAWPVPALADEPSREESPSDLAREGVENLMRALNALIEMIPQYELPELNENGDIIIRRKRDPEKKPVEEPDQTQT